MAAAIADVQQRHTEDPDRPPRLPGDQRRRHPTKGTTTMATETANGRTAEAVDGCGDPHPHPDLLDRVVAATRQERLHDPRRGNHGPACGPVAALRHGRVPGVHADDAGRCRGACGIRSRRCGGSTSSRAAPSMRADAPCRRNSQRHGGCLRHGSRRRTRPAWPRAWHPVKHPEHLTFPVTLKELVDSRVACVWEGEKRAGPARAEWRVKDMYTKYPRQMLRAPG